jgi:ferritin
MRISSQMEKAINDQIAYESSAINAYVATAHGVKELDTTEVQHSFSNKQLRKIYTC